MNTDDLADKGKKAVYKAATAVEGAIDEAAAGATRATRKVHARAGDAIDQSQDAVESALRCATQMIRDRPLTSVVVVGMIAYIWGKVR